MSKEKERQLDPPEQVDYEELNNQREQAADREYHRRKDEGEENEI